MTKIFIYGIDGAPPELIFDRWKADLPNISALIENGIHARMESTIPPATNIAWNSMLSGQDASKIGVFAYTYKDNDGNTRLVSSNNIKTELIWDILGDKKRTISLFVPLSFPVRPINGMMVSGFLTPDIDSDCAYPKELKEKIKKLGSTDNFFDVTQGLAGHKSLDIDTLLKRTYEMSDMQTTLMKDLITSEDWDLFITVLIGTDRLQHMLWQHFDQTHRRFIKDSKHKDALKDYYIYLDKKLGEILNLLDDDTIIIVASDHGMARQEGKININNWLMQEGYLKLNKDIKEKTRFKFELIDKSSRAWATGAYHARIFVNKDLEDWQITLEEIENKLKLIPDDKGEQLNTKVFRKEDIYDDPDAEGCPDLTVYFDDLSWASNPDLGQEGLYSWETAVGADSAGHSRQGCFIIAGPGIKKGKLGVIDIRQIAPTLLRLLDQEIPKTIKHKPIEVT